jgi:hypothetical protein
MACFGRRGCADRFRGRVSAAELLAVIRMHGSCGECGQDATDSPRFADPGTGFLTPYCPACYEARWPTGAPGPFERGKAQVYR